MNCGVDKATVGRRQIRRTVKFSRSREVQKEEKVGDRTQLADCVYALHASREEQELCPHVKNHAFDAGMLFKIMTTRPTDGLC